MDVLGEKPDLHGLYSARAFVGWYNGLPEFADLEPDLRSDDTAVIIGQGNVAIDVARILLSDVKDLQHTDISAHALKTLSRSKITRVHICGRRGPMQASFTIKELRELLNLPSADFLGGLDPKLLISSREKLPRVQRRIADLLNKYNSGAEQNLDGKADGNRKRWSLDFFREPCALLAHAYDTKLDTVCFQRTEFVPGQDPFNPKARVKRVIGRDSVLDLATDRPIEISTSCCFRSIGYKSEPLPDMDVCGIPFDEHTGTIRCDGSGRILDANTKTASIQGSRPLQGMYCAGWVKNGPTGVIAASMEDAFATADTIADDWESEDWKERFLGNEVADGWDALRGKVQRKGFRPVSWEDWIKIDRIEREMGEKVGKPREKLVRVRDMLSVLDLQ